MPRDLRFETAHTDTRYFVSIPYAELEDLSVRDRAVWGGARNLLELESPELAAALVARIGEIRDRAPGERGAAIAEQLRRDLSLVGVRERLAEVDRATGVVRFAAWAALALVFGILPLAVYLPDAMRTPPTALVLFLVLAYAVLIRFGLRAERAVSSRGRDWGRLFPMIASPITSLHLAAEIGRYALVDFDRAVVAVALLDGEGREAVLRREVQRCEIAATITGEDAQVYWSARLETLHALAREVGLDPGRLSGAPESIPVGEKYCPLCDAGYRGSAERCADCGVPLRVREPA